MGAGDVGSRVSRNPGTARWWSENTERETSSPGHPEKKGSGPPRAFVHEFRVGSDSPRQGAKHETRAASKPRIHGSRAGSGRGKMGTPWHQLTNGLRLRSPSARSANMARRMESREDL